ncbi:sensor histidine kinase [Smaragdicoccus niigatensis]|uniref:sensor histidine kinase n=1 Tax=Smaragdicoccus niigatensis TaxID=359359 RepID=UPI000683E6F1|nr:ATP-binding protein [Smaragdicoccus niigatensis]
MRTAATTARDTTASADLNRVRIEFGLRGADLQVALRVVLVAFLGLTLLTNPPKSFAHISWALVGGYALFAAAFAVWAVKVRSRTSGWVDLLLFVDLGVMALLTLITGTSARDWGEDASWAADIITNALFVLPVLACTQLRPWIGAFVVVPTVVTFFLASWITQDSNSEPWSSIWLSTLALAGVGLAAVGFCAIQSSRVKTISGLVSSRTALLGEVMGIEGRERQQLSEQLHDGALQLVLAARMDANNLRDEPDPDAVERIFKALTECSKLLRTTVSELHPAVLQALGLSRALSELARTTQARGIAVELDSAGWTDGPTEADGLLYGTARELLSNVVKHAGATTAYVTLDQTEGFARLTVADDGVGMSEADRERSLKGGHIGLASHELRLVAAGGSLSIHPRSPSGTEVRVEVPLES